MQSERFHDVAGFLHEGRRSHGLAGFDQGAGFDRIDLEACTRRGIVVCNAFGAGAPAVAEFTFGSIMAVARKMFVGQSALRAGEWFLRTDIGGTTLVGATLGIVGLGHIGRELARMVQGFRMPVLYYDVVRAPNESEIGVSYRELPELLAQADFVSINVGLNPATYHMIGDKELEQWQYEVTGAGRVWYCPDPPERTVWLTDASVGHPKATE